MDKTADPENLYRNWKVHARKRAALCIYIASSHSHFCLASFL